MAFCFMIGIAGGETSEKSELAAALCEAYSHRTVIHLTMDEYQKPEQELSCVTLETGNQCCDRYSPDAFDIKRLHADIDIIVKEARCRILVVEGLFTLWDSWIEEMCDARVYLDSLQDSEDVFCSLPKGETMCKTKEDFINLRHKEYVASSKAEADIVIECDDSIEQGVWKIRKALRGLWL